MEVTRGRGKRRKKLLDDLKDRRGYSHLTEEALDRTMWRNRFGGDFGPVVRQNTEWMNTDILSSPCCFTHLKFYSQVFRKVPVIKTRRNSDYFFVKNYVLNGTFY
jgi:hypothetical protein